MTLILASRPNVYSSSPLDRIGTRREDHPWIEQQFHNPESLFVPVWRNRNLVTGMDAGAPEAVYLSGETAKKLRMSNGPWAFLGLLQEQAVFAQIEPQLTRGLAGIFLIRCGVNSMALDFDAGFRMVLLDEGGFVWITDEHRVGVRNQAA